MKIGIIGLGWYGKPMAEKLVKKHTVAGTKSSKEGVDNWDVPVVSAQLLDLNKVLNYSQLKTVFNVDCIIVNIPPSASVASGYSDMMEKILIGIKKYAANHLIFISSTGVFGDHQHEVDEDTIPEPTRGNGEVLHRAEKYFANHFSGRLSIIRPGGLVGGERHPAKYLAGRKKVSGQNHPINLVHRNDLIALTQYLIENETTRNCFHAVAAQHPSKREFYTAAIANLGLKPPRFDETDTSQGKLIHGEKSQAETIEFEFNDPFEMG